MLMQNFKSAADLGITDAEQSALIKVLGMFERQEIPFREPGAIMLTAPQGEMIGFNMLRFFGETECGTVACIAGWAIHIGRLDYGLIQKRHEIPGLYDLFDPYQSLGYGASRNVTTEQAASALRSYLTTGDARWDLAVA